MCVLFCELIPRAEDHARTCIRGCTPHSSKRTTVQDPRAEEKRDLIGRDFTSPIPTYKLIGDTTYLKTGQGWLYLACVIDLYSRMVVGWALSLRMTADIVIFRSRVRKGTGLCGG
ncbi:MAG: DDE-type integrase/transposase/recombinase [Atopobiaceae bacterium]|nr:DDE-type integrase/transposase/recombinase [Atopobiaceae bacterium]